jgi:hypothetical protein
MGTPARGPKISSTAAGTACAAVPGKRPAKRGLLQALTGQSAPAAPYRRGRARGCTPSLRPQRWPAPPRWPPGSPRYGRIHPAGSPLRTGPGEPADRYYIMSPPLPARGLTDRRESSALSMEGTRLHGARAILGSQVRMRLLPSCRNPAKAPLARAPLAAPCVGLAPWACHFAAPCDPASADSRPSAPIRLWRICINQRHGNAVVTRGPQTTLTAARSILH